MAGLDITGFTSITLTSEDLDNYSDNVTMCLNLSLTFVEPSCSVPSAITFSNITDSAATVSWTAGGTETAWNLEYGPTGFVQGEGTVVAVDASAITETGVSYALSGLSSGTTYDVYVQADCGDGLTSVYVGPSSFTTSPGCGDTIICLLYTSPSPRD